MVAPILYNRALIKINGINPYIHITAQEAKSLKGNWRKPMPVYVQVNGKPTDPWRINMVPMGNGDFYLYLHNDVRESAGVRVGDIVDVRVWFDESYRSGPQDFMPEWFSLALSTHAAANKAWEALSPSRQKEVARYLRWCRLSSRD